MSSIHFFTDGISFRLNQKRKLRSWILDVIEREGGTPGEVNVVLVCDDRLLQMNRDFLNHDYYTDIMTFQEDPDTVSGEIYISIDRVKENARKYKKDASEELHRVIIHGFLHMLGYSDKSDVEKEIMRAREDFYLTLQGL